jgi:uncharacterized membrane protein YbaN (DUF454 family)
VPSQAESPLARIGFGVAGLTLTVIGIVSLPVPLFPSFPSLLLGLVCLARASTRFRGWLARQPHMQRLLMRIKNPHMRARICAALGLDTAQ